MIKPIEHLGLYATPFGGEIEIYWKPRQAEGETITVFKSTSVISPVVVSDYLANPSSLPSNVQIAVTLQTKYNAFVDTEVENGTRYYYAVAAKNSTQSTVAVFIDGTAQPGLKFNVQDGKDIVFRAITRMLSNLYAGGQKVELGKDIECLSKRTLLTDDNYPTALQPTI